MEGSAIKVWLNNWLEIVELIFFNKYNAALKRLFIHNKGLRWQGLPERDQPTQSEMLASRQGLQVAKHVRILDSKSFEIKSI